MERSASELFLELIEEMERRYRMTRETGSDNLREHIEKTGKPLARIVCVCDEYYALVAQQKEEKQAIEQAIGLLGAKGRAPGIYLILATQQPSRQIISGAIQSNFPCRVALYLQNPIASNMIINQPGAERLTGSGDLLYKVFGNPVRLQAPYLPGGEGDGGVSSGGVRAGRDSTVDSSTTSVAPLRNWSARSVDLYHPAMVADR